MKLRFAQLNPEDIDGLMKLVPKIDPDPIRIPSHRALLEELVDGERNEKSRFSCFSRTLWCDGKLSGHVSARLVSSQVAERVCEAGRVTAYEDVSLLGRRSDWALAKANRSGPGSVLVVSSLFWDKEHLSTLEGVQFPKLAIERMVRFFEGNYVTGCIAVIQKDFQLLVRPLEIASEGRCTTTRIGRSHFSIKLSGPWKGSGLFLDWGDRLLTARPDYSLTDEIKEPRRFQSRILHECGFDVEAAWEGNLLPEWNKTMLHEANEMALADSNSSDFPTLSKTPAGKLQQRFSGISRWRKAVGKHLEVTNDKKQIEISRIEAKLKHMPSLMTPSLPKDY